MHWSRDRKARRPQLGVILSIGQNNTHSEKPPFAAAFAAKLPSIEMRSRKGLQFAMAPADLSLLLTGRVMVSCFIQFHLASCTESEKGRLPGLAVSAFPVGVSCGGLPWSRLLDFSEACKRAGLCT